MQDKMQMWLFNSYLLHAIRSQLVFVLEICDCIFFPSWRKLMRLDLILKHAMSGTDMLLCKTADAACPSHILCLCFHRWEWFAPTSAVIGKLQVRVCEMYYYLCFLSVMYKGKLRPIFKFLIFTKTHELPEKFRKFINSDTKGYYFVVVGRSREEPSPFCLNSGEDVPKLSGNFHRSN